MNIASIPPIIMKTIGDHVEDGDALVIDGGEPAEDPTAFK